jgi:hypothetical protein
MTDVGSETILCFSGGEQGMVVAVLILPAILGTIGLWRWAQGHPRFDIRRHRRLILHSYYYSGLVSLYLQSLFLTVHFSRISTLEFTLEQTIVLAIGGFPVVIPYLLGLATGIILENAALGFVFTVFASYVQTCGLGIYLGVERPTRQLISITKFGFPVLAFLASLIRLLM